MTRLSQLYPIVLLLTAGALLFAGAVVAPVVFHANDHIPNATLSTYEMGSLMTEIFRRSGYLIGAILVVVALIEAKRFYQFKKTIPLMIALSALLSGGAFIGYYLPAILALQQAGEAATLSTTFQALHAPSEMAFKLFTFSLIGLGGYSLWAVRESE